MKEYPELVEGIKVPVLSKKEVVQEKNCKYYTYI